MDKTVGGDALQGPGGRLCVLLSGHAGKAGTAHDFTQKSSLLFRPAKTWHQQAEKNDGKTRRKP
ncbi:MAG: hypothetical protein QM686_17310 [Herbaspirillum sp.]|uniref:hypothetical protein n=1 Tax=Herbaspirillum TaxID=963 RepID=UPI001AB0608E|nr:hypothetical protein [Herbaspirillum sp. 1130]MBP1317019.1 hypothetical protein [Herbaspirillum sp. 1130]